MVEVVVRAIFVPDKGHERAVVWQIFDEEIGPIARNKGPHLKSVVEGWDDTEKICETIVEICGVEVVLAVVRGRATPFRR